MKSLESRIEALEERRGAVPVFIAIITEPGERDEKLRPMSEFRKRWPDGDCVRIVIDLSGKQAEPS